MPNNCLYCYKPLADGERNFHPKCCRKIFGIPQPPELPYTRKDINQLATEVVRAQTAVTGVQPKLSVDFEAMSHPHRRFTIVGLWGRYILKPQTDAYPHLPELEDLTMHLAEAAKIETVPHSLIRFADGELCYITRRIDRTDNGGKIAMEDMCQLSERLTEDKYRSSHERVAKLIRKYSSIPQLDIVKYWEQVLFSWIIGNADMHLKNYSLYSPEGEPVLTPAYDLLSTAIVMPEDIEELALTLAGKKRKLKKKHFINAMTESGLTEKVVDNIINRFVKIAPAWEKLIAVSFLPEEMQIQLLKLISARIEILLKI